MISVVVLGAGHVGTHLCKAISTSEQLKLVQWYNRSIIDHSLSIQDVNQVHNLNDLVDADVYIIAVSDGHVEKLSNQLPFKNRLVVHTSGSVPMRHLNNKNRRGVFYPLQTFSKTATLDFKDVPICVESTNKDDRYLLKTLAEHLGSPVYAINSEQRQALHLSAVFVNNFTNQLYRIAHELSDEKNLDFEILKPLISETAKKINHISPYMAQTGPAKRRDQKTIRTHLKLLENHPNYKKLYEQITTLIQKTHG
ncbi:MAG: DUF2520 domain-containing protein [Flavobacteriaceae bacterium]|nr:DUF2520 domain-containing protein [Flavobacteriaceae bacterium]